MKVIILFGAGASLDPHAPSKSPPLGKDLFRGLSVEFSSTWGSLPLDVAQSLSNNFEEGMGIVYEKYSELIPDLMQDMAVYFARFYIRSNGSPYLLLLAQLGIDRVVGKVLFSSLNYDCLFEEAITWLEGKCEYGYTSLVVPKTLKFMKLHGSCNFPPGPNVKMIRSSKYTRSAHLNPGIVPSHPDLVEAYCRSDTALYSTMSFYMPKNQHSLTNI